MTKFAEKVATVFEKLANYLDAEAQTKEALVQHNRDATAQRVVDQVIDVLGDQIDEKTASQLRNNETALQLLNQMNQKVSELGGPAPLQRPASEKTATQRSTHEEAQRASDEFAAWALGD